MTRSAKTRFLPTRIWFTRFVVRWALPVLVINGAALLLVPSRPRAVAEAAGGIALTPSVVMLKGSPGQAHRQVLSLTNTTSQELTFDLIAEDIVADGQRRFLPAGERPDSIAATALFAPRTLVIPPGGTGSAQLTITVPHQTAVRAIAAIFRSRAPAAVRAGVGMTASLGTLLTFTLSSDERMETSPVSVTEQTDTRNLRFIQSARNVGSEPLYFGGAVAVLDSRGVLIARMPVEAQRLLPGERLNFSADYPTLLAAGRYRAVFSLEHAESASSAAVDFTVALSGPNRVAGRTDAAQPQ